MTDIMRLKLMALLLACAGSSAIAQSTVSYTSKLSANTLTAMLDTRQEGNGRGYVQAYIKLHNDVCRDALAREYGIKFNVGDAGLYTALIPTDALHAIASDQRVRRVDTGNMATPTMDRVRQLTNADQIATDTSLPTLYDGTGVIVGVIDNGFDFTHPAFKDANGKCRISCAWDQNAAAAQTEYGYGMLYDTTEKVLAARHDNSYDTHGTHVLGIAAGSPDNAYKGMATGADIAIVSTNKTEQGIIDGVDFLIKYAQSQRKPIAINISYGSVLGYKDGTGNFATMLDRLLADKEGVVLGIATGNEGNRKSTITASTGCKSALQPPSYGRENIFVQGEPGHLYSLCLTLKNVATGDILLEKVLSSGTETTEKTTDFGTADRANALLTMSSMSNETTGAPAFSISLSYLTAADEQWQIAIGTDGGRYLAECDYGSFATWDNEGFVEGSSASTLASTATGHEPIAVGAYVSRPTYTDLSGKTHLQDWTEGDIYSRSGKGPTFDGRTKPDVVAPGASVVSSLNSFAATYAAPATDRAYGETHDGRTYYWGIGNGTSMATPVATGIMALWLQADNTLTNQRVKQIISSTAKADQYAHDLPNDTFGHGKIDAIAGIRSIVAQTGIANNTAKPSYDIQDGTLYTDGTRHVAVYTTCGTKLMDTTARTIDLSPLGKGIYILRIGDSTIKYCQKQ